MRMRGGVRRFQVGGVNPATAVPTGGAGTGPFAAGAPANGLGAAPGLNPQAIQQALQQRRSMAGGPPALGGPAGAPAAGWPAMQGAPQGMPQRPAGMQGMPPGMPPGVPQGGAAPPQGMPPAAPPPGGMPMRPGMGGGGMGPPPAAAAPAAAVPAAAQSAGVNPALVRPPGMAHGGEVSEDGDKGGKKSKRFSEFKTKAAEDIPEVEKKARGGAVKRRKPPAPKVRKALPPPPPPQEPGEDDQPDVPAMPPPGIGGGPVSAPPPPGMKKGGKWIQDMHMKEGALHKDLHVPEDKKIPKKKLNAAAKKGGKVGERARVAKTLGKFAKGGKSDCDKMAAGGAMKVRRGFPNTLKAPKKLAAGGPVRLAAGGKVRGCGAATKGCTFSGVY